MEDVTCSMDAYRECARHVWNTYFQQDAERDGDWDLRDHFNEVALTLFRALVLRRLGRAGFVVQPDQRCPRQVLPFLHVRVESSTEILVNRDLDSGYWDHPLTSGRMGDLQLRFLQYFDWSDLGSRDFAFYRVRVVGSVEYPDIIGKDALVPVGPSVRIFGERAAQ